MNSNGKNLELPRSLVQKMLNLRKKYAKVYFYLLKAVTKSIEDANAQIEMLDLDVDSFEFEMTKDEPTNKCLDFRWRVIAGRQVETILLDANCNIKNRMQNFHKIENDKDFILTYLYFVSKILNIPYILISDNLFDHKIKTKTTDVSDKDTDHFIKTIAIDLRQI